MEIRMKRYNHFSASVFFLVAILFLIPQGLQAARMKIKDINYSESWQTYLETQIMLEPAKKYPYDACFRAAAKKYRLPLTLLLAVAKGESDFNPKAKSPKSCYGIMQIQWPGTAKDLGFDTVSDLYNPCKNIKAGAKYIRMMLDRYDGDRHLAIAAYNYGPGQISKDAESRFVPKGAVWYSGYIYHHLQTVLKHARPFGSNSVDTKKKEYTPGNKIPVIIFHDPIRATNFLSYFKNRTPDIPLDWFRTSLGETYVVMVTDKEKNKQRNISRMKELGFNMDVEVAFW